jgi:hypothetical protein
MNHGELFTDMASGGVDTGRTLGLGHPGSGDHAKAEQDASA